MTNAKDNVFRGNTLSHTMSHANIATLIRMSRVSREFRNAARPIIAARRKEEQLQKLKATFKKGMGAYTNKLLNAARDEGLLHVVIVNTFGIHTGTAYDCYLRVHCRRVTFTVEKDDSHSIPKEFVFYVPKRGQIRTYNEMENALRPKYKNILTLMLKGRRGIIAVNREFTRAYIGYTWRAI